MYVVLFGVLFEKMARFCISFYESKQLKYIKSGENLNFTVNFVTMHISFFRGGNKVILGIRSNFVCRNAMCEQINLYVLHFSMTFFKLKVCLETKFFRNSNIP